jgi:hypothetical protein
VSGAVLLAVQSFREGRAAQADVTSDA